MVGDEDFGVEGAGTLNFDDLKTSILMLGGGDTSGGRGRLYTGREDLFFGGERILVVFDGVAG